MPSEPWVWAAATALIVILLAAVGYLIRRDRQAITDETRRNHVELSGKIDKVETDLSAIRSAMVQYVPRHEYELAHARQLDEQRHERSEMKGYFTAMIKMLDDRLGRIETAVASKVDKA